MGVETVDTVKGHGFTVGDTVNFYGMGSDAMPTRQGVPCVLTKQGTKYVLTYGEGDTALTWEFGPSAKVWASKAEDVVPVASDVLAAMAQPATVEPFSDRDMRDQIVAYLGTDVDGFYVDGIIDDIIARKGGAVNVDTIDPAEFTAILEAHATTVATVGDDYLNVGHASEAMLNAAIAAGEAYAAAMADEWHARESLIWSGTGTLVKPAIRTLLGRRKRKATRRARRTVKGGF